MSETPSPTILAFDCSGGACSAALLRGGTVTAERFAVMERGQAETLLPQIQAAMAEAGIGFEALDLLATVVGPGSFTGLRLGLSAARGLALASNKPIVPLTAFEAYLAGIGDLGGKPHLVAIDSRRGPVFAQLFGPDRAPLGPPEELAAEEAVRRLPPGPAAVLGDGMATLQALDPPDCVFLTAHVRIRAADIARAAASLGSEGPGRMRIAPLYLRAPDVTMPKVLR